MNKTTQDFLSFRRMITPIIIQAIFWIGVVLIVLAALAFLIMSLFSGSFGTAVMGLFGAVLYVVLGPILLRIYCELIILFFRMNETLTEIKNHLAPAGTPPAGSEAAPPSNEEAPPTTT